MKEVKLTYDEVEALRLHFEKLDKLKQLNLKLIGMRAKLEKSK